jgi:hypothetical protein
LRELEKEKLKNYLDYFEEYQCVEIPGSHVKNRGVMQV